MKIKKIIDLIKKRKIMHIFEGSSYKWLSDGFAIYPLFDLPEVTAEIICAMYDITPKEMEKMAIKTDPLPKVFNFKDCDENEQLTAKSTIEIAYHGKPLILYASSQGVAFVDKRYFAPFADIDEDYLRVYERYSETGNLYFAVKNGFELVGIILPERVINKDFVDEINNVAKACTIALQNVKEEEV